MATATTHSSNPKWHTESCYFAKPNPEWAKKDADLSNAAPYEASSNPFGIDIMSPEHSNPFAEDRAIVRREVDFGVIENAHQSLERFWTSATNKTYQVTNIAKEFTIEKVLPTIVALGFLYISIKLF